MSVCSKVPERLTMGHERTPRGCFTDRRDEGARRVSRPHEADRQAQWAMGGCGVLGRWLLPVPLPCKLEQIHQCILSQPNDVVTNMSCIKILLITVLRIMVSRFLLLRLKRVGLGYKHKQVHAIGETRPDVYLMARSLTSKSSVEFLGMPGIFWLP